MCRVCYVTVFPGGTCRWFWIDLLGFYQLSGRVQGLHKWMMFRNLEVLDVCQATLMILLFFFAVLAGPSLQEKVMFAEIASY